MKVSSVQKRHGRPLIISLFYELYIRLYRYSAVSRKVLQLFVKTKKPKGIFFVIGSYNAGTTVIKRVLATHPDISFLPIEGDLLTSELSNMEEGGWHRCLYGNRERISLYRKSVNINAEKLLKDWAPWIKKENYFLEKSIANSVRMEQLRKAFPGCKFVNVIRSPEGVVNGIKKRSKPTGNAKKQLKSDTYPEPLLYCQWSYIYNLIKSDSRPEDTYHCSYENFITNPDSSTKSIFKYLGLKSVPIDFTSSTLSIDTKEIYIRPLQSNDNIIDYSNPEFLTREIERLKCD